MYAVILLGIICVALCLLSRNKGQGLKGAFFFVTLFLAIRYDWGNDYIEYLKEFKECAGLGGGLFDINVNNSINKKGEWLWTLMNRLANVVGIGFFGFVIILTVFENWCVYRLVKKYVEPKYYWVALIFYVFPVAFCVNASMMRQYFCMCLYMLVFDLMNEKNVKGYLIWSVLILIVAGFVHKSCWFLIATLPVYYLHFTPTKQVNVRLIIGGLLVFVVWDQIGGNMSESSLLMLIENMEEFETYDMYIYSKEEASSGMSMGWLFALTIKYIMFVWWLIILSRAKKEQQTFLILGIIIYLFDPVIKSLYFAHRVQSYLAFVNLLRWPLFLSVGLKDKRYSALYVGMLASQILLLMMGIPHFYLDSVWIKKCFEYHTIFSARGWM